MYVQLVKKPSKLDEKMRRENWEKIENLIDKKPPKLDEETRRKRGGKPIYRAEIV